MFETAVGNSAKELGLEQEVAETGRVNTDVAALLVDIVAGSELALLAVGGSSGGLVAADLLIGVVDEILLVGHDDVWCWGRVRFSNAKLPRKLSFCSEVALTCRTRCSPQGGRVAGERVEDAARTCHKMRETEESDGLKERERGGRWRGSPSCRSRMNLKGFLCLRLRRETPESR